MQAPGSGDDKAGAAAKPAASALQATVNARPFIPGGAGGGAGSPLSQSPSPGGSAAVAPKAAQGSGGSGSGSASGSGGPAARMSAGAASFVPRSTPSPAGGGPGPADPVPKSPQQQMAGGSKGLAPPLRSPGKPRGPNAGGPPSGAFPGPGGGPGSGGGGGRAGGRGVRGPSRSGGGGRGLQLGGMPGGLQLPGLDLDAPGGGGGRNSGSGKRGALLAQHPGNYAGSHGAYSAGAGRALLAGQFMSEALRQQLQQQAYLVQSQWLPSGDEPALPDMVGPYHTLAPLEDLAAAEERPSATLGVRSCAIKGISAADGAAYALRRIDGRQVLPSGELLSNARAAVEAWALLAGHPGLVCPREAFVTADLDGSPALVVAAPYHPGAVTAAQAHMLPTQTASGQLVRNAPNEAVLWSYTVQLSAALRAVHAAGLAVRPPALSPSKVLVLPLGRLRIGSLGLAETLSGEVVLAGEDLAAVQRDDVVAMGQLLLALACSANAPAAPSLDAAAAVFSPDFVRLLALLLAAGEGGAFSWRHVSALAGERMMAEVDGLAGMVDGLMSDLTKEMENGRLLRLLVKLGFINERPEGDAMSHWSETGDRYLLRLFRDYVFHATDAEGAPRLDFGHVIECLNKLDAGVPEEVLLMSRDEQSLLVASYADVRRCVEGAYAELRAAASRPGGR